MKIAVLLGFLSVTIAFSQGSKVQVPEEAISVNGRIIEGWPALPNQFPHMAYLRMVTPAGTLNACGGSLITSQWVLTAAHCLVNKTWVFVRLGNVNVTTPGLILESQNFFVHPQYNPETLNNDLGLINLGRTIESSDSIRPIRLPGRETLGVTFAGEIATASGWGRLGNVLPVSETLNFVNLTIIENSRCILDYDEATIVNSTICAVGIQSTAQSTCNGDSGGPLVLYGEDGLPTLIGVVSFVSDEGCDADRASGYVRPQFFLDWINDSIEAGMQK